MSVLENVANLKNECTTLFARLKELEFKGRRKEYTNENFDEALTEYKAVYDEWIVKHKELESIRFLVKDWPTIDETKLKE